MQTNAHEGTHVAVIMDGNGRWAAARGLPRVAGHREGAKAVERTVEAAARLGVATLTLYAFSADNWQRPRQEVQALMELLETYLRKERGRAVKNGVRVSVIGRRDRLTPRIVRAIEATEKRTRDCGRLHLRLAIDYSGRQAIVEAVGRCDARATPSFEQFAHVLGEVTHTDGASPDVDLLIRTSGEQRLSDFLLWECAYAEFVFCERMWPDFGEPELAAALATFHSRDRRFGRLPAVAGSTA